MENFILKTQPAVEKPRGGNYLTDPQPEENKFHHIPEQHLDFYLKKTNWGQVLK